MRTLRLLMAVLSAAAGLVVLTSVPAVACSCVAADTDQYVEWADTVFTGTLTAIEQTEPGGDAVQSSLDPARYTFDVEQTFKGDAGDGVIESARSGASCGLEGMQLDQAYVVFASESKAGELEANLCGGTTRARPRLLEQVAAAVAPPAETPTPTATEPPQPAQPLPTTVPSGVESPEENRSATWLWFAGGVLLASVGGVAVVVGLRTR